MKFEGLEIDKNIIKAIQDIGYTQCTPVQEQTLPESLQGKDIISQSQTGTGKTAVFLITILNRLMASERKSNRPRAVIMLPTRELAVQVEKEAKLLSRHCDISSIAVYGGTGYDTQETALRDGVDIVAATPGRLIDFFKNKVLALSSVEIFVIDEADRMFDMGFTPDIKYIADRMPTHRGRQTMLFSATIDGNVRRLAMKYMRKDPVEIEIEPEQLTVDLIDQKLIYVSNDDKISVLMALLKREDTERTVLFTNMKRTAERLGWKLEENGFNASVLTGDVSQAKRERIINNMKSGKLEVLVATDVAARGLHIEDVTHVINYDLPADAANYVHRIGRTARAGKAGKAYSLVCEDHVLNLPQIELYIGHKIEKEWIEDTDLVKDRSGNFNPKIKSKRGKTSPPPGKSIEKSKSSAPTGQKKSAPAKKKTTGRKKTTAQPKKVLANLSTSQRLEYYNEKYGEKFLSKKTTKKAVKKTVKKTDRVIKKTTPTAHPAKMKTEKKGSVLKKILGAFRKNKKD